MTMSSHIINKKQIGSALQFEVILTRRTTEPLTFDLIANLVTL